MKQVNCLKCVYTLICLIEWYPMVHLMFNAFMKCLNWMTNDSKGKNELNRYLQIAKANTNKHWYLNFKQ